jgi:hypothetical protein
LCSLVRWGRSQNLDGAYLVMKNKPKASKIDDLRARSTCEQDRSVCVILHVPWSLFFLPPCFLPQIAEGSCKPKFGSSVICVCVWFCISRDMIVWLSLCSTIFCMIYLLTCKYEEEQANGGWLIRVSFDVISLCVWFCISRDILVWLSLCSTMFCIIYLPTCKAWRTSRRGLVNPCLLCCNLPVISHILPITKATWVR